MSNKIGFFPQLKSNFQTGMLKYGGFDPNEQITEEERKRRANIGLQSLSDSLYLRAAQIEGNPQQVAQAKNMIEARKIARAEKEQKDNLKKIIQNSNAIPDSLKEVALAFPEMVLPSVFNQSGGTDKKYEKAADGFYRYIDDGTKVFGDVKIPKKGFEITTGDVLGAQKDERKTFEATNKGVKNFQQLLDAAKAADGAASYALMIKFIKQLDDSVVREGEVATFGGFQGALTNLKNQISKTSGEGFTPDVKANMINLAAQTANRLVNDYGIYRAGKEASYSAIGFDPNMVFAGLDFNLGNLDLSRQYTANDFEFIELE